VPQYNSVDDVLNDLQPDAPGGSSSPAPKKYNSVDDVLNDLQPSGGPAAATPKATPQDDADYANMPWSEVGSRALSALPGSAASTAVNVGSAVMHPIQTAENVGQIGKGFLSQAKGWLGYQQDQDQKTKDEALANAVEEHFAQYGSSAGIKKAIATDPIGTALDVSTPLTLGSGAAASVPGTIGKIGKLAGDVASFTDPVQLAGKAVGAASGLAKTGVTAVQAAASGAPMDALKTAVEAGAGTNPAVSAGYWGALHGNITPEQTIGSLNNAVDALRKDRSATYVADQAKLLQGNLPDLDWQAVKDAHENVVKSYLPKAFSNPNSQHLAQVLKDIGDQIDVGMKAPSGSYEKTLPGMDEFKQGLGAYMGQGVSATQNSALMQIKNATVGSITSAHPDYVKMMGNYSEASDKLKDIKSMLGHSAMPISRQLSRVMSSYRKGTGSNLISDLSKYDPSLPGQLAGHALSPLTSSGLVGKFEYPFGLFEAIQDPSSIPALAAGAAVGSPKINAYLNYGAGKVGSMVPSASKLGPAAAIANDTQQPYAKGGRVGYAKGGHVKSKKHDKLVKRLLDLAELAKEEVKKETKPILNVPDAHVIKALAIAKQGI